MPPKNTRAQKAASGDDDDSAPQTRARAASVERTAASSRPQRTGTKRTAAAVTAHDDNDDTAARPVKKLRAKKQASAKPRKAAAPPAAEDADNQDNTDSQDEAADVAPERRKSTIKLKKAKAKPKAKTRPKPKANASATPARADTAENYPDTADLGLGDKEPYASYGTVRFTHEVSEGKDDIWLRFVLQVYPDDNARLLYRLRLFVHQSETEADKDGTEAGYIHAYRIAKSTQTYPDAADSWPEKLVQKPWSKIPKIAKETALCLRALYDTKTLQPSPSLKADHQDDLRHDALLFIGMIHIREPFRGQRLLKAMLERLETMLAELPEWFAFRGSIVLIPARPKDEPGRRAWIGVVDGDVEETLIEIYEKYDYEVWLEHAEAKTTRGPAQVVTVMGKHIPDPLREESLNDGLSAS